MKFLAAICTLALFSAGCGRATNAAGETIVLEWTDVATGNQYQVTTKDRPIFGSRSTLSIRTPTTQRSVQIDDDATFGTAALIRDGDWILVASDDDIWAGYDTRREVLVGENDLDRLPYTIGARLKSTVVTSHVTDHSQRPAGFVARAATKPDL